MSKNTFGIGLIVGALTGAAAAFLFAPKSGEEFQSDIKDKANDTKKKAVIALDDAVTDAEIWLEDKKEAKHLENQPVKYEKLDDYIASPPEGSIIKKEEYPDSTNL